MSEIKGTKWIKNYVLMVINEVKSISKEERDKVQFRLQMTMKHKTFSDKFPSLLMLIVDHGEEFDLSQLDIMLNLLESVQSGGRKVDEVDKEIGQEYYDKYVSPYVNDTDVKKL
jgi:hypothetical protein